MWLYAEGMSKSRHYPGGRATTLKPAFEPIVLARRELEGTTEETIARYGTGALNAEECQVEGRHPANVIFGHDPGCEEESCAPGCPVAAADACASEGRSRLGPSRFLYCPKASRAERDAGCEQSAAPRARPLPERPKGREEAAQARNPHPTVKPLELMRWLVRLLCPPGGLVLDPTVGSGTTGAAAVLEGRRFIGIELEPAYMEIAAARIAHHPGVPGEAEGEPRPFREAAVSDPVEERGELRLGPESIEAMARRLAELLASGEAQQPRERLISAEEVAEWWGWAARWVYDHADELGAHRLGGGSPAAASLRSRGGRRLAVGRDGGAGDRRGSAPMCGDRRSDSLSARSRAMVGRQARKRPGRRVNAPRPGADIGGAMKRLPHGVLALHPAARPPEGQEAGDGS